MKWEFPDVTFNDDEFNCLDQNIALCAAHINKEYYYYYFFYLTMCSLWDIDFPEEFTIHRNTILDKFGLCLKKIPCKNASILAKSRELINCNYPVILFLKRCTIPYYKNADVPDVTLHSIIISDFNDSSACLFENLHLKETDIYPKNGYNIYEFWVHQYLVESMWSTSNLIPDGFGTQNNVFIVDEIGPSRISSYKDLINDILKTCSVNADNFVNLLRRDCFDPSILSETDLMVGVRLQHINPRKALLQCMILWCKDSKLKSELSEFKETYITIINQIMNRLCVLAKRNKILNLIEREGMISKMEKLNIQLFEFLDLLGKQDAIDPY